MKPSFDELKLVIGAMVILAMATSLMVVVPWLLLDRAHPVGTDLKPYTEQQLRGRQQYIANGCMYCHSQQPRDPSQGPDMARGWGRPSVAMDYYYDNPHLLGTMRTGPDLLNIGARQPSRDWHLGHLYQPRAYLPGSIMPAYPFLFEERPLGTLAKSDVVVKLPPGVAPPNVAVVARGEAIDLVAYLLSLDRTYPVVPRPKPPAAAKVVAP
jgi:cytochrome c oxidase cbb3-type subunit 2